MLGEKFGFKTFQNRNGLPPFLSISEISSSCVSNDYELTSTSLYCGERVETSKESKGNSAQERARRCVAAPILTACADSGQPVGSVCETARWNSLPRETLEGSFSAVSTPIFATKYSFCSIFRDLQDLQTFAPLHFQNLLIFFLKILQNFNEFPRFFVKFCWNLLKSVIFRRHLHGFLLEFHRMLEILMGLMLQTSNFQIFLRKSRNFAETFCRHSASQFHGFTPSGNGVSHTGPSGR